MRIFTVNSKIIIKGYLEIQNTFLVFQRSMFGIQGLGSFMLNAKGSRESEMNR